MADTIYQEGRELIKIISGYIRRAKEQKVKVISVEREGCYGRVLYDGNLVESFPGSSYRAFVGRIKVLAGMPPERAVQPQEGRISKRALGKWDVLSSIAGSSEFLELTSA